MHEINPLILAFRTNKLNEARERIAQGEKLPKDIGDYEREVIYEVLAREKAFDLIDGLIDEGFIETDIYEYDKLDKSVFESIFKNISNEESDLVFLKSFIQRIENINDAIQDKTLLGLAFLSQVPIEVIKMLVDAGCDVHYKDNSESNFLYSIIQEYAIKEPKGLTYLEFLIQEGLDPNAGNIIGDTPLHLAISKNLKKYVEFLLQQGANLNQPNKKGETPFYKEVVDQGCSLETYNMMKEYAVPDFDLATSAGETLLLGMVRMNGHSSSGYIPLLTTLIHDGADVYQTSLYYNQHKSALDWICEQEADVLQAVLETGTVDLERRDNKGNTLLHNVCAYNVNYDQEGAKQTYRKVKLLIEHGADANGTNDADQTPMDLAATDNLKTKTVELLLKNKA